MGEHLHIDIKQPSIPPPLGCCVVSNRCILHDMAAILNGCYTATATAVSRGDRKLVSSLGEITYVKANLPPQYRRRHDGAVIGYLRGAEERGDAGDHKEPRHSERLAAAATMASPRLLQFYLVGRRVRAMKSEVGTTTGLSGG